MRRTPTDRPRQCGAAHQPGEAAGELVEATVAGTRERTSQGQRQTIVTFRNEAEPNAARSCSMSC
jgi:hypothetical protein